MEEKTGHQTGMEEENKGKYKKKINKQKCWEDTPTMEDVSAGAETLPIRMGLLVEAASGTSVAQLPSTFDPPFQVLLPPPCTRDAVAAAHSPLVLMAVRSRVRGWAGYVCLSHTHTHTHMGD
jgi:hypothetical protein